MSRQKQDLSGLKFNKLTLLKPVKNRNRNYYLCQCDCGKQKTIRGDIVKNGWVKSCGCIRGLPQGESIMNYIMLRYKQQAKSRGHIFSLSKKFFRSLILTNCHYCNAKPNNIVNLSNYKGTLKYNGIDRKNNKKGYTINNVVACCKTCNFMKKKLSYKKFLKHIETIFFNRIGR